ncbi:MAG: ABC transporter substrate-binding protein [Holosporales bacterium]|jgi:putative ABC transport system substrate-binding protein|nr:ABC transporter substrate-binding protein [Holosporales bacterium]
MLKKLITVGAIIAGAIAVVIIMERSKEAHENTFNVSICKVIEHEALNAVVTGIRDCLGDGDVQYTIDTCQGNPAIASQIISKFIGKRSNVIVAVGTTPAQVAFSCARKGETKLVFSSVTNPNSISTNLTDTNTTGVSNFVPLEPQVKLFTEIQPDLRKLGIIYNTGEANSVDIVWNLREAVKGYGVELIEQGIQKASDIPQAVEALLAKGVDAVFISNDNMALANIPLIVKLCNRVPVYVSDTDQVSKGCIAALGPNQYDIGIQTGKMIKRILYGEDINAIKIEYPSTTELHINKTKANKMGLNIPQTVIDRAVKTY